MQARAAVDVGELVEALFVGAPEYSVPGLADRYEYKKKSGSSDGQNTSDEIET